MKKVEYHEPVMVREVTHALHIKKSGKYIDATVGTGGHAEEIVKEGASVLGIDMDTTMLEVARKRLGEACPTPNQNGLGSFKLIRGDFKNIDRIAKENGFEEVSGILFDLGISNVHLASSERGFSFAEPGAALDMRLDAETQGVTGSNLLNVLREDQLRDLFSVTMDAGGSRWLSKKVVTARAINTIETVGDFLQICQGLRAKPALNPGTLPFLALRIAVNSELENLKGALPKAFELLESYGRLVVISFHSGEDRIVKEFWREKTEMAKILTKKPTTPTEEEIYENPGARSAKMRVLEKYEKDN